MLYASSKKDLLLKLGSTLFADSDWYVDDRDDLTYEGFVDSQRTQTEAERHELLTEAEQAVHLETEETESSSAPVGTRTAIAFQFDDDSKAALQAFAAGERKCVEVYIHPKKEVCKLGNLDGATAQAELENAIVADEPRYFLLNYGGRKVFVYYCPEDSKVYSMVKSFCETIRMSMTTIDFVWLD